MWLSCTVSAWHVQGPGLVPGATDGTKRNVFPVKKFIGFGSHRGWPVSYILCLAVSLNGGPGVWFPLSNSVF